MKYQSELIKEIVDSRGHKESSLHYESECVETWIEEAKGGYPKLCDYESEWIKYISILDDTGGGEDPEPPIGEFPYVVLSDVTEATIDNVVPYAYKSAILKGNTLVNLVKTSVYGGVQNGTCVDGDYPYKVIESIVGAGASILTRFQTIYPLSPSTVYYLKLTDVAHTNAFIVREHDNGKNLITEIHDLENKIIKFTTSELGTSDLFFYQQQLQVGARVKYSENFIISNDVESLYSADDYFTGMQSVKMPVLTTTGKNTFNIKNKGAFRSGWYSIPLESPFNGELYVKGDNSLPSDFRVNILAINKNEHTLTNDSIKGGHTGYYQNLTDIEFHCPSLSIDGDSRGSLDDLIANGYIVIELGGEPYKSNILTVNEEVELRGIGGVRDELDLLTGKVTERIGEIILKGSEPFTLQTSNTQNHTRVSMILSNSDASIGGVCNKLRVRTKEPHGEYEYVYIQKNTGVSLSNLFIQVENSKLTTPTLEGVKTYLQTLYDSGTPLIIQYGKGTESIKTVDLNIQDQNGKTLSVIRPIEGKMFLSTSSDTIKPLFSGEIPVEAITQNLASFIDLD